MMAQDLLAYYVTHGELTDPGERRAEFENLPTDVAALCRIVQGVLIHDYYGHHLYGPPPADYVVLSRDTLPVSQRLSAILASESGPISRARPPFERSTGTCRDFALLLCSMLRHRSVPARVRCGFAAYFSPGSYEDHWICEYWKADEQRWARADCQLDDPHQTTLSIDFDITDVPREQFVSPWQAWRMCESDTADPTLFGHGANAGRWFLQVNLVRDLLSLHKREVSPWDSWRDAPKQSRIVNKKIALHCVQATSAMDTTQDASSIPSLGTEEPFLSQPPWVG